MLSLEERKADREQRKAEETRSRENANVAESKEARNERILKGSATKIAEAIKEFSTEELAELHALESAKGDKARANVLEEINKAGKAAAEKAAGWDKK